MVRPEKLVAPRKHYFHRLWKLFDSNQNSVHNYAHIVSLVELGAYEQRDPTLWSQAVVALFLGASP